MKAKFLVVFIVLCTVTSTAFAQQSDQDAPASKEEVERYLSVVQSREMMQQMVDAMSKPIHKMVHDMYLKQKDKLPANFEQKQIDLMDDMFKQMPFDQMMQAMVPIYEKHFTNGDIEALIAFQSSPTGEKMRREMPAILGETIEAITPMMEKYGETVQKRVQDEFAQALKDSEKKAN